MSPVSKFLTKSCLPSKLTPFILNSWKADSSLCWFLVAMAAEGADMALTLWNDLLTGRLSEPCFREVTPKATRLLPLLSLDDRSICSDLDPWLTRCIPSPQSRSHVTTLEEVKRRLKVFACETCFALRQARSMTQLASIFHHRLRTLGIFVSEISNLIKGSWSLLIELTRSHWPSHSFVQLLKSGRLRCRVNACCHYVPPYDIASKRWKRHASHLMGDKPFKKKWNFFFPTLRAHG